MAIIRSAPSSMVRRPTPAVTRSSAKRAPTRAKTKTASAYRTIPAGAVKSAPASAVKAAPSSAVKKTPVAAIRQAPASAKRRPSSEAVKTAPSGVIKVAPPTAKLETPTGSVLTASPNVKKEAPTGAGGVAGIPGNMKVSIANSPIMQELAGRHRTQRGFGIGDEGVTGTQAPIFQQDPKGRTILASEDPEMQPEPTLSERMRERMGEMIDRRGVPINERTTIGPIEGPNIPKNKRGPRRGRQGTYGRGGVNIRF